jgi:hypothetical protein
MARDTVVGIHAFQEIRVNQKMFVFLCVALITSTSANQVVLDNRVNNGDFSSVVNDEWKTLEFDSAKVSIAFPNNTCQITMIQTGFFGSSAQLAQSDISLDSGKTYLMSVRARADQPDRLISFGVRRDAAPATIFAGKTVFLSAIDSTYSLQFIMNFASTDSCRLFIDVGLSLTGLIIDDVSLCEVRTVSPFTLSVSNPGNGTIVTVPDQVSFDSLAAVTLTAIPATTEYRFAGWWGSPDTVYSENPLEHTMVSDVALIARFSEIGGNLIVSGDFGQQAPWQTRVRESAKARGFLYAKTYSVEIIDTDPQPEDWHVRLIQDQIPLYAGNTYTLSFDVYATEATTIAVAVSHGFNPSTRYVSNPDVSASAVTTRYVFDFTMPTTDFNGQVEFKAGLCDSGIVVTFDNVSLKENPDVPTLREVSDKKVMVNGPIISGRGLAIALVDPVRASLQIYSLQGRLIGDLSQRLRCLPRGRHCISWSPAGMAQGAYILRINDGSQTFFRPVIATNAATL